MINIFSNDKNKCNHINKIQDKKLKEGNIYDICISKKIINNNFLSNKNQKYNENHCAINFDEIFKLKKMIIIIISSIKKEKYQKKK
jgi:uncharacterized protein YrrD